MSTCRAEVRRRLVRGLISLPLRVFLLVACAILAAGVGVRAVLACCSHFQTPSNNILHKIIRVKGGAKGVLFASIRMLIFPAGIISKQRAKVPANADTNYTDWHEVKK